MDATLWDQPLPDFAAAHPGLTSAQAAAGASHATAAGASRRTARLLLRQFTSPIVLILVAATIISIAVDDPVDGAIILVIILASGLLGFVQERRADDIMLGLVQQVRIHADVLRDGREVEVPLEDVVAGDVVVLRAGDIVPADIRLTTSLNLLVDESSITGEYVGVEKTPERGPADATLPTNGVFYGSHVVSGEGRGVAVAVGPQTRFGSLLQHLQSSDVTTRFEREMTRFGVMLTRVMLGMVAVILVVNVVLQRPFTESLMFALALAVGITPQLLPAIVAVSLSVGARQLAREAVLVKRLDAIEDIGGMTVLCCDKTGTLTRGVVDLDRAVNLTGADDPEVLRLAAVNAALQQGYPNAMDEAIGRVAGPVGDVVAVAEVPYDFQRRCLSVLADIDGERLLVTKGAVASVLDRCEDTPVEAQRLFRDFSAQGLRTIAVATKRMLDAETASPADESGLTLVGFLTFDDPATPTARDAIRRLRAMNVEVCLITGDSAGVAQSVAASVGLPANPAVTGERVAAMPDAELSDVVRSARVFAQVDPVEKERIVQALRGIGHTVGFLGDGINDAAALRAADVGISVDTAADVSKHAAALVILSKNLDVVADGIRLGRRTFANTLKYIRVTISANFGNVMSMVVASVFLPFLPMLPAQILLLNLLSDGPAMTIATDRVDPEQEATPRVWSTRDLRHFMIVFGLLSSAFDIGAFAILRLGLHAGPATFHTAWFVLSLMTELVALLVLRTGQSALRSRPSRALAWACLAIGAFGVALPFLPLASRIGMVPLSAALVLTIAILSGLYVGANEIAKRVWQRRRSWV